MKTIFSFLFLSLSVITLNAQTIELQFNRSSYNGGYNISCNGATDGSVTMIVIGGTAPYTYQWSNNETTKDISNLAAGTYNVTVTDDNSVTATGSVTLLQPSVLGKTLTPSNYNGYNISIYGLDNGSINLGVSGGTPPYSFLWSNAETTEDISNLVAGNYSVTITDMNNCTTTGNITLTQPTQLVINSITSPTNSGGFNISCYGGADGSISVTSSGGVSPYTYVWSHGPTTNPLNAQSAGNYTVRVSDANSASVTGTITLTQPTQLNLSVTRSIYNNGYNISCHNCANGYINSTVSGGFGSYTYEWKFNSSTGWTTIATTQNITNRDAGQYLLRVTDGLNCEVGIDAVTLVAPQRDDWSMQGNADTDPNTQYMGTSDATDFVMRTAGEERLRITSDGDLKVSGLAGTEILGLLVDENGKIIPNVKPPIPAPCNGPLVFDWQALINPPTLFTCPPINVGIGTYSPQEKLQIDHSDNAGGIFLNQVNNTINGTQKSEIKFGYNGTPKMAIGYDLFNNGSHSFFIWDHLANSGAGGSRFYINSEGQVGIGHQPGINEPLYKLYVEGGIKARDIKVTVTAFPDYVFEDDYNLMTIKEYGEFIKINKHLPGIPSGKEVIKNEGFDVGALSLKLLEKIEEQALYIIELQRQIDELK